MLYFFDGSNWNCFPIIRVGSSVAQDIKNLVWVSYWIPNSPENREVYGEELPAEWGGWFDPAIEIFCPD